MISAPGTSGAHWKGAIFQRTMAAGEGVWPRAGGHVAKLSILILFTLHLCVSGSIPQHDSGWESRFFFLFSFGRSVHVGVLVPGPGIKSRLPAVEVQSLNHWTTREVPGRAISCLLSSASLKLFLAIRSLPLFVQLNFVL